MKAKLSAILVLVVILLAPSSVRFHAYGQGTSRIVDVAWSPDGEYIARTFSSGTVEVVNVESKLSVFSFVAEFSLRRAAIAWNPVHSHTLAAGVERYVYVWNVATGETLFTFLAGNPNGVGMTEAGEFTESIYSIAWTSDGGRLATLSLDGILRIWNMSTGEMVLDKSTTQTYSLDWSPDGTRLFAGRGVAMRVVNSTTGEFENFHDNQIVSGVIPYVDLSPDGTKLAGSTISGEVMIWDVSTGQIEYLYSSTRDYQKPSLCTVKSRQYLAS